jgi:Mg2+ and Co2+ transporter CorA
MGWSTSGDLGTGLAIALIETLPPAYRVIEAWLQRWELDYYRARCQAAHGEPHHIRDDVTTLNNLLSLVTEFRRLVATQDNARGMTTEAPWYPDVKATQLDAEADRILDGTGDKLQLLFDNIRADMELVSMNAIAEQAQASARQAQEVANTAQLIREQGKSDERFQQQLGNVTALLLVPTLIAGVFGANTQLPGGGRWIGFELMVLLMVLSSVAVFIYVRPARRVPTGESTRDDQSGSQIHDEPPPTRA